MDFLPPLKPNSQRSVPMRALTVLFFLALFGAQSVLAQTAPALRHGLNLSSWLANAPRQPIYRRDLIAIKNAGFDHVRLPFNPEYYGYKLEPETKTVNAIDFIALDRAIEGANELGLPVILDLHPSGEFIDTLERHSWAEKDVVELWAVIARRYASIPSIELVFELLNEPQYYKSENLWTKLSSRLVRTIRQISPERSIVVGAPHGSDIEGLSFLQPSSDPHILYSFHFYEPYLVTHQGIHMGFERTMIKSFRQMPYPSDRATKSASDYAPTAPDKQEAQKELDAYKSFPWNAEMIGSRINIAASWAQQNHVRILCGEYGVLRNHIDPVSRYQWIKDTREAMDQYGIGWELWDYTDLFGIAVPVGATSTDPVDGSVRLENPDKGRRQFESASLIALGLKPADNTGNVP